MHLNREQHSNQKRRYFFFQLKLCNGFVCSVAEDIWSVKELTELELAIEENPSVAMPTLKQRLPGRAAKDIHEKLKMYEKVGRYVPKKVRIAKTSTSTTGVGNYDEIAMTGQINTQNVENIDDEENDQMTAHEINLEDNDNEVDQENEEKFELIDENENEQKEEQINDTKTKTVTKKSNNNQDLEDNTENSSNDNRNNNNNNNKNNNRKHNQKHCEKKSTYNSNQQVGHFLSGVKRVFI